MKKFLWKPTLSFIGIAALATLSAQTFAHSHGPHVHGVVELKVAVEGDKTGSIVMSSPGDSLYGFEYDPKTKADKSKQSHAFQLLIEGMPKLFILDPSLNCSIKNLSLNVVKEAEDDDDDEPKSLKPPTHPSQHGEHSEVHGEWSISCAKPLEGTEAHLAFTKTFPRVQSVHISVSSDLHPGEVTIQKDQGAIKL